MEWQKGITALITAGGQKGCAVEWALKGWEITELAMGNESSLYQSRSRSSVDL